MFIVALFTIARIWKQPRCPPIDEQIKKMGYIYTVECYSAIQKEGSNAIAATWVDLEIIRLSERERQIPYDTIYMGNLKYDTSELLCETETDSQHREENCSGQGSDEGRIRILGHQVMSNSL